MKYFVNNIFTMIYLFMHKSYFFKKIDIAGRIKEQIRNKTKERISGSKKCEEKDAQKTCQGCFLLFRLTSQVRHWK